MSKATVKTSWLSLSLQAFSLQHLLECFCFIVLLGCSDWMAFWQDQHRLFYKWLYLWPTMQECTRWPNMQIVRNIFAILRVTEFAGLSLVICNLIQFCDPCSRMNIFAQFKRAIQRDGKQKWHICHKAWSFFSAAIAGHHLTVPWGTTCQTFHRWLKFPATTSISRITRIQELIAKQVQCFKRSKSCIRIRLFVISNTLTRCLPVVLPVRVSHTWKRWGIGHFGIFLILCEILWVYIPHLTCGSAWNWHTAKWQYICR